MNLLPFENIDYDSPLTENEVRTSISNNVAWNTKLGLTFTKNTIMEYEGFVDTENFKIRRILKSGRNSFIPTVTGKISKKSGGTKIELKLRLHKVVMIFAVLMTLFSGSLVLIQLLNTPVKNNQLKELLNDDLMKETLSQEHYKELENMGKPSQTNWLTLLFFIAPYLMCTIFYNYEASIVKLKLKTILKIKE